MTLRKRGPRMLEVASAAALTLVGCSGSRGAPAQAPIELEIAPLGDVPGGGIQTNGQAGTGRCALRLAATRIEKSSPNCYLDEHINKGHGLLHYPCAGDGPVEAEFGDKSYRGSIAGGEVDLELAGELDWDDGCRWGTRAVITGTLVSNGEPALERLNWQYKDFVLTGTSCSGVCTARASIDVTSTRARAPEAPVDDDVDDDDD